MFTDQFVSFNLTVRNCPIYAGTPLKRCHWYRNEEIDPRKSNLRKFSIRYPTIFHYHFWYIYQILKLRKCQRFIYQSTQNFTLISKMYNFICSFCVFFDLWLFKVRKWPVFAKRVKTGHFQTLNDHKSKTTQNKHTKLYIFEISVKFCVDWYINLWHLGNFKIWYI